MIENPTAGGISDVAGVGSAAGAGVSAGGASGASGQVGTGSASQETASKSFEGSIKQATDVNAEEIAALLTTLLGKDAGFLSNLTANNAKRTADVYQAQDIQVQSGAADYRDTVRNLTTQALQNALETANLAGKQAVRHADIAIDRQWNVDEQGYTVAEILRDNTFKDAVAAAVAIAVNESK